SLANGLSWLATLQKQSGDLRGALQTFQDELQMRYALCERDRLNMRARYLLAISHSQVGLFHRFLGHGARAREHFGRMNELASELAVHDPDNSDWRRELAFSQHLLGELQYLEATSDEATRTLAESERLFLALAEADATNRERQLDVVSLHCTCSEERYAAGEVEAALAFADRSIARLELISNDDQEDRDLGAAWTRVLIARGRALTALNRAEEAMKDWERGLAIFESLFVENPDLEFRSLRVMLLICLERDREAEMLLDVLIEGGFRDDLFVRFMADSDLPAAKAFASEPVSVRAESERELESDPNP
ncbi:MAG: hypothetical protein O7G85_10645, partial [Planctomycetota bacterium]|nr:hypothetical protein [Planctomycetota bacterium]